MQRCRRDFSRRVVGVLAALVLAGCSPDEAESPSPTPTEAVAPSPTPTPTPDESPIPSPSPSPTPTPEPSPSPTSTLSPEQQAAADAVMEYFRLQVQANKDIDADLQPLMEITDGNWRRIVTELVSQQRSRGVVQVGESTFSVTAVEEPEKVEGETQIVVFACLDSSGTRIVDAVTGADAAAEEAVMFIDHRLVTADRDGWKVVDGGSRKVNECP